MSLLALLVALTPARAGAAEEPVDWERARALHQRAQRGETLPAEDQSYYERAKALRQTQRQPQQSPRAVAWTNHLTPLTELAAERYKGELGGLYGAGRNDPPAAQAEAARKAAAQVRPLDADGQPSAAGKIGLLAVGMSNTTMEFSRFKAHADRDPAKSPQVVIVDGAQGGQTASRWANATAPLWSELDRRLRSTGLAPAQVQVVWIKQAEAGPARLGDFLAHTSLLQSNLACVVQHLKTKFPNLRLAYLSSRIYGGYATTPLNPEPYAYESAFAVRGLIQAQERGDAALNWDAARGTVKSPVLLWGPYLWADGATARRADGLTWVRGDFASDGTHPGDSGREKVAGLLLKFFKSDPTARDWFTAGADNHSPR